MTHTQSKEPSPAPYGGDWKTLGAAFAELVLTWRLWTTRKIEQVAFVDEQIARRTVTVEFTIPNVPAPVKVGRDKSYHYVPLVPLQKRALTNFDLSVNGIGSVSMLARGYHKRLVTEALLVVTESELEQRETKPLSDDDRNVLRQRCEQLAASPPEAARASLKDFEEDERFESNGDVMRLVEVLASSFLVIALIPAEVNRSLTATFSYDERIGDPPLKGGELLATGAAWKSKPVWFRVHMHSSPSYHLLVEAPPGLQITRRFLVGRDLGGESPLGPYRKAWFYRETLPRSQGFAVVHLRPLASTVVRASAASAILSTLLLAALGMALLVGSFKGGIGAAPSALLFAPGVLSVLLVRAGEHPMATDMLFALRMLTLIPGGCAFTGAVLIGAAAHHNTAAGVALLVLALVALIAAGILVRSWALCRSRSLNRSAESGPAYTFTGP